MIVLIQPRPISILATAAVFGYEAASLLATGIRTHVVNQIIGGSVFAVLAILAAFFGIRWAGRFIRGFFS
jgi:hypothetical protein